MKTETIYKRAFNDGLDLLAKMDVGHELPSENELASQLDISRTTVRKVLHSLGERG